MSDKPTWAIGRVRYTGVPTMELSAGGLGNYRTEA